VTADVQVHHDGPRAIVAVRGEIDIATSPALDDAVAGISSGDIVIDLAGVTFMGSSGLASLLRAARRAEEIGGALSLRAPSKAVCDLLTMTHLVERFTIVVD